MLIGEHDMIRDLVPLIENGDLNDWEAMFIFDLSAHKVNHPLSPKQSASLEQIWNKHIKGEDNDE